MKYYIDVREVIDLTYAVEADSEEEAIKEFEDGNAVEVNAFLDEMEVMDVYLG